MNILYYFSVSLGNKGWVEMLLLSVSNGLLLLFAGSGPYVVIDNRSKSNTDAKGSSSDEGKLVTYLCDIV